MSAGIEPKRGGQDFDLNLAPIIDVFTVLITFMLASASFLAIGVFDASVAANSATANAAPPPSVRVDVELNTQMEVSLRVAGKMNVQKKIAPTGGKYDTQKLVAELQNIRSKFPDTKGIVLSATDDVAYLEVIGLMEQLKKDVPSLSIFLGGL
jgi:biopolymer transport protein ExbD